MNDNKPYSRAEIEKLGSSERPSRGTYCPKCCCFIPEFEEISNEEIKKFIENNGAMEFSKFAQNKLGINLLWTKLITVHHSHFYDERFSIPCPYCESPINETAKQCLLCKMDWHDEKNPARRGESIADRILNAHPGSELYVQGFPAYRAAYNYANKHRPNDSITVKYEPVPKKF